MRNTFWMIIGVIGLTGCQNVGGNVGHVQSYAFSSTEADWIRKGEPIEYDGRLWFPEDGIELLLDSEMMLIGEYRGVQFFVDKRDVQPYNRLYTKFGPNRFRYFEPNPST